MSTETALNLNGRKPFDPSAYKEGVLDKIDLDGFEVGMSGGRVSHPHAGESVWLLPYGLSLEDELKMAKFLDVAKTGTADQEVMDEMLDALCARLSKVVVGWTITDPTGTPYPQPTDGPALKAIPSRLFKYLMEQIRGEEPEGNAPSA